MNKHMNTMAQQLAGEVQKVNRENSLTDIAPRRVRRDREHTRDDPADDWRDANKDASGYQQLPAVSDETFARNALNVYEGIKQLQDKERAAREELNAANARIEQFVNTVRAMELTMHNIGVELDRERAERIRLATIIENVGGLIADGMSNVKTDDPG